MNPFFGWKLGPRLGRHPRQGQRRASQQDGNELFCIIFGLMFFKGILASLAGPAPNYDMQRILATRNPREASLMNGMVNVVLMFPRYMMIAGITVLALAFCMPELRRMAKPDFEQILPIVLSEYVPTASSAFCWPAWWPRSCRTSPPRSTPRRPTSSTTSTSASSIRTPAAKWKSR